MDVFIYIYILVHVVDNSADQQWLVVEMAMVLQMGCGCKEQLVVVMVGDG